MADDLPRIAVLSHPEGGASGNLPLSNLVEILVPLSREVIVITGGEDFEPEESSPKIQVHRIDKGDNAGRGGRILWYSLLQIRSTLGLLRHGCDAETWVFFINGQNQVVPMLAGRALRRRIVLVIAGSTVLSLRSARDPMVPVMALAARVTCGLADRIVVYGDRLVSEYGLGRWSDKIDVAPRHIVRLEPSPGARDVADRGPHIGFIGRFSEEKGPLRLIEAMPAIISAVPDARLTLIGDGPQRSCLEEAIERLALSSSVSLTGWVPHAQLGPLLQQFRLVTIPSFTEGLPNVMLEAMACGAVVAATPVGAIPDLIRDGETGFLMESNSPDSIASTVIRALRSPDLSRIAQAALEQVRTECTLSRRVARYREILVPGLKKVGITGQ